MSIPGAFVRKAYLYSLIPELESIDMQIGIYPRRSFDISALQSAYQAELASPEALALGLATFKYIQVMEEEIMKSQCANVSALSELLQQKVTLLESAYSNVSSTQGPPPEAP